MIEARNGIGYYVKNYSDLGDYKRTIVGLLVIGIVVSFRLFCLTDYRISCLNVKDRFIICNKKYTYKAFKTIN